MTVKGGLGLTEPISIAKLFAISKGGDSIAFVYVDESEPLEKALKRFKRMVEKEGIIREFKKREFYEKPSEIRNRKKKSLERKLQKRLRKMHQANHRG